MLAARAAKWAYNSMIEKDKVLVAYSTCPNSELAETISRSLVSEQLAACVNQVAGVRSIYKWQGQVQTDVEVMLIIKTTAANLEKLAARLNELHPYELPELIALPVCGGSERYLDWVRQTVTA
jgi:periplasmic divalent cation tolerance protein